MTTLGMNTRKPVRASLALIGSMLLAAGECEEDPRRDGGVDPPGSFDCELGLPGRTAMDFVPLGESDEAELQVGFQGLSLVPIRVLMSADAPDALDVVASADIEGFSPIGFAFNGIEPLELADGRRLTRDIQVPINRGVFADYIGRTAHISIRLSDDNQDPTKLCVVEGDVVLLDQNQCIHTGDVPLCPFDCEIGVPGPTAMDFVPLSESNESELQLDAQGESLAPIRVRMAADAPDQLDIVASASIDGLSPMSVVLEDVTPIDLQGGQRLTRDLKLPIEAGSFADYVGRTAYVWLQMTDDNQAPALQCLAEGEVVFVNNDECIHTGDAPLCADAGPEPGPDAGPLPADAGPDDVDAGPDAGGGE